ncbi:MAG: hypothetical protein FD167_2695, partial [bacterium]
YQQIMLKLVDFRVEMEDLKVKIVKIGQLVTSLRGFVYRKYGWEGEEQPEKPTKKTKDPEGTSHLPRLGLDY